MNCHPKPKRTDTLNSFQGLLLDYEMLKQVQHDNEDGVRNDKVRVCLDEAKPKRTVTLNSFQGLLLDYEMLK